MLPAMVRTLHNVVLRNYLRGLPRGESASLAVRLGISMIYLHQLAARQPAGKAGVPREPSPELCVRIEEETGGAVTRQALRPDDWPRIWPELRGKHARGLVAAVAAAG